MSALTHALAMARLRALRLAMLDLHKALLDAERRRYEHAHGRIESPHQALRLALEDPWFSWLAPLASLVVEIDERLADEAPVAPAELNVFVERVQALLMREGGDPVFKAEYHRSLQEAPDVVVLHGRVVRLVTEAPQV